MSQRNPRTTVTSAPICTLITHLTTCSVDLHNLKPYDLNTIIALIRIWTWVFERGGGEAKTHTQNISVDLPDGRTVSPSAYMARIMLCMGPVAQQRSSRPDRSLSEQHVVRVEKLINRAGREAGMDERATCMVPDGVCPPHRSLVVFPVLSAIPGRQVRAWKKRMMSIEYVYSVTCARTYAYE